MRAAIIEAGVVTNVIEVENLDVFPDWNLVDAGEAHIGDLWDGEVFSKPTPSVDIEALKLAKNTQINQWRADANLTTFPHADKTVSCDALSRSDIDGVANNISLTGAFPVGFPNAWKAVDNTYIELPTVEAFKDLYKSMTMQGTLNFGKAQQLKAALAAAATQAEIEAITWE